jgi:nucleotide-binding universal stress UspA family protein
MTEPQRDAGFPRSLLLATDLTSRGDRALDRAARLARDWRAELHVVHAVEAAAPAVPVGVDAHAYLRDHPDPRQQAMRQLRRLVGDLPVRLHVEDASPAEAILEVAAREGCGLIVLGESRERLVGPLERTSEAVVRSAAASVLTVRDRPSAPYRHLLVGTDFTDEARQALERAAALFPTAAISLVHARPAPYAGLLRATPDEAATARQLEELRRHLEAADLPEDRRRAVRLEVAHGPVAAVLRRQLQQAEADLTVIGAHPRGMLFDAVVGSSRQILESIPGDVLVVRARRRGDG